MMSLKGGALASPKSPPAGRRIYVGLDIGKGKHEVAAIPVERFHPPFKPDSWQRVQSLRFPTDEEGFQALRSYLGSYSTNPLDFTILCEPTGGYYRHTVVTYLLGMGYHVWLIPNRSTKAFRERLHAGLAKTDAIDARMMARMAFLNDVVGEEYAIEPVLSLSSSELEIRTLVDQLWHMQKEITKRKNQLQQLLMVTFPEIYKFYLGGPNAKTALILLSHYGTPLEIANASDEELYDIIVHQARDMHHARRITELKELASRSVGVSDNPQYFWRQNWIVRLLMHLEASKSEIEAHTKSMVVDHPYHGVLSSFPVSGTTWSATLIGTIGDIRRFKKGLRGFKSYMGFVPKISRSGVSSNSSTLSNGGVRATRRALYQMVMSLVSPKCPNNVFKEYYQSLVGREMRRQKAMVHTAGKLATVIYSCLRNNTMYDEAKHRREREVNSSPNGEIP